MTNLPPDLDLKRTISNEEIQALPMRAYSGPIDIVTTATELNHVVHAIEAEPLVGFDTETKPSFKKGEFHKVALVQLAIPGRVFLIQIQKSGLSEALARFLSKDEVLKAGVAIRDDIKGLQKFRRFMPGGFVDLAPMARERSLEVESVKKLTALLLGFRISKTAQTSNWEAAKLTDKQIEYAATDAWVCFEIFKKLNALKPL